MLSQRFRLPLFTIAFAVGTSGVALVFAGEPATQPSVAIATTRPSIDVAGAEAAYDEARGRCLDGLGQTEAYKKARAAAAVAAVARETNADGDVAGEAAALMKANNVVRKMEAEALAGDGEVALAKARLDTARGEAADAARREKLAAFLASVQPAKAADTQPADAAAASAMVADGASTRPSFVEATKTTDQVPDDPYPPYEGGSNGMTGPSVPPPRQPAKPEPAGPGHWWISVTQTGPNGTVTNSVNGSGAASGTFPPNARWSAK
jgi:hypothetical protein